jgi:TetR/AcrR family transcriptional regulator, tetracycline repressor protein
MAMHRTKRARRNPALSKEKIVAAALALIDRNGAADFSLRDVARRLGVYPTAIYWHVPGRNALIGEIAALAMRDIVPPVSPRYWRAWLKGLFRRYRAAVRRHPNIAPLLGAQLVSNTSLDARMIDGVLTALTHAGYRGQGLVDAFNTVVAAMSGFVTMEFGPEPAEDPRGWAADLERRIRALGAAGYPVLARHLPALANRAFILRWQNGTKVPLDSGFEAFIDSVVRGLAARAPDTGRRGRRG